ncbi:MAG: outer membrane lipoprotein carrier protein LolA [Candidatus Cloacimonetes bacterium]|nr:outer membrane lipoprotein carrier protein LolA [Candidatus Cloacimonadota bacterium]
MVICRIKILLVVLLVSSSFLFAQNQKKQLTEIYENILIKYARIKFYEADFQQENYWKEMDVIKKSQGKVYFDVDHFILKYTEPKGQILMIENNSVTIYDAASNQVFISSNIETELRPDKFISEYWGNSEKKLIFSQGTAIKLQLTTPNKDQISILLEDSLIIEILILDADQNFVLYKFNSAKINEDLPKNIFEITLPEDATILDNR